MYCIVNLTYTMLMRPNRSKQSDQIVHGLPITNTKSSHYLQLKIQILVTSILVEYVNGIIHNTRIIKKTFQ